MYLYKKVLYGVLRFKLFPIGLQDVLELKYQSVFLGAREFGAVSPLRTVVY